MQWFQIRNGSTPQNAGAVAFDYDMVFAFKAMPAWLKAMQGVDGSITSMQALEKGAARNGKSTAPGAVRAGEARAIHEYQYQGKPVPVKPR